MATELHEGVPDNLRQQLALAVRSIQWSYAIFWSISARQPRVLEWGDGYYNGDIKTRKTIQSMELDANQIGLQRSEQLRELFGSLSAGEASPQAKRPSVALSPEDLTDAEWYYLVCMSFTFNVGQGLPGRTLANGQPIWLCNAHFANSKYFSRSLLAKSASIKTVVCFPFLNGVVELGVTEPVLEDPELIQLVKSSFLEVPYPILNDINSTAVNIIHDAELDHEIPETKLIPVLVDMTSLSDSSNGMGEGVNAGASQAQSWQLMDDELSNCIHQSMSSSDCISQTFIEPEKVVSDPYMQRVNNNLNPSKWTSADFRNDDLHYQSILTSLLKNSHQLVLGAGYQNRRKDSSFVIWKKGLTSFQEPECATQQTILKKVLFEVPRMHSSSTPESPEENGSKDGIQRPETDKMGINHALSEKRRREKLNERFLILRSIVPSISKDDKITILDEAIGYVKELEKRVQELESNGKTNRRLHDSVERTSENHGNRNVIIKNKKQSVSKRKAHDVEVSEAEISYKLLNESSTDHVNVSLNNKEVLIETRCHWREGVLLEIMDVVSNLHLDSHSVQSSVADGILTLTIKSKFNTSSVASVGMIKQAVQKITRKS